MKRKENESAVAFVSRIATKDVEHALALAIACCADELARGNVLAEADFALSLGEDDEEEGENEDA